MQHALHRKWEYSGRLVEEVRGTELVSSEQKAEVWECFLEEAGLELDSMTVRMMVPKAPKVSAEVWPWGPRVWILTRFYEPRLRCQPLGPSADCSFCPPKSGAAVPRLKALEFPHGWRGLEAGVCGRLELELFVVALPWGRETRSVVNSGGSGGA